MIEFGTLTQVRGDRQAWPVTDIRDAAGILVTSGTLRLVVKDDFADPNASAIIDASATIVAGAATVVVTPAMTTDDANTKRWLHYDFQVDPGGGPETLARGVYILEPEVALA
jgi:hypothetical protein